MSEDFQPLALRFRDPIQHDYEVIRDIVLHDETVRGRRRHAASSRPGCVG